MMKIINTPSSFKNYLSTNISKYRTATTFIISSSPPTDSSKTSPSVSPRRVDQALKQYHGTLEHHIKQCSFTTSMQFNLKTINYQSLSSAYPTKNDIESALELIQRTGSTNIIGVGSGAAIDLAKACHYHLNHERSEQHKENDNSLLLVPGTLGATLASVSPVCMYLNTQEEALFPFYSLNDDDSCDDVLNYDKTVIIDEKSISFPSWLRTSSINSIKSSRGNVPTIHDAALASLVIAIDTAHALNESSELCRDHNMKKRYEQLFHNAIDDALHCLSANINIQSEQQKLNSVDALLSQTTMKEIQPYIIKSLLHSGQLLSFGTKSSIHHMKQRRSLPMTLSSSLLPRFFPCANFLTFTASLLTGLCSALHEDDALLNSENSGLLQSVLCRICNQNEKNHDLFSSLSSLTEWVGRLESERSILIPSLASLTDETPDVNLLMNDIEANCALMNTNDLDSYLIEKVLLKNLHR